jgi:hypothetical protein
MLETCGLCRLLKARQHATPDSTDATPDALWHKQHRASRRGLRIGVTAAWHCQQSTSTHCGHTSDSHGRMPGGLSNLTLPPLGIPPAFGRRRMSSWLCCTAVPPNSRQTILPNIFGNTDVWRATQERHMRNEDKLGDGLCKNWPSKLLGLSHTNV